MTELGYQYDDGGRREAGFKGRVGDCVCRVASIVLQRPYREVYDSLKSTVASASRPGRTPSAGVRWHVIHRFLVERGLSWRRTMGSADLAYMRREDLPAGRLVVKVARDHVAAVVDHVVHDTYDPTKFRRDGSMAPIYGYWVLS